MVSFEVKGVVEALRYIKDQAVEIKKGQIDAMNEIGLFMVGQVKNSIAGRDAEPASVDTGRFLQSVNKESSMEETIIFSELDYSQYLEYGTTKIPARRHFNNSLDRNKGKIVEVMNNQIKNKVK